MSQSNDGAGRGGSGGRFGMNASIGPADSAVQAVHWRAPLKAAALAARKRSLAPIRSHHRAELHSIEVVGKFAP